MAPCNFPATCDGNCGGWHPGDPCPCRPGGCGVVSTVLRTSKKGMGHVRGCKCRSHIGSRNSRKGQAGQAKTHKLLGGEGPTPGNEESARAYSLKVRPETKRGDQVPAKFVSVIEGDHFRRAMQQARNGARIGAGVTPAVCYQPTGGGAFLIVELEAR